MNYPERVLIKEVGPRDGLQNEKVFLPTQTKIDWINQLSKTGLSYIEITSFVNPKWIPALSDCYEVAKGITREPGVTYAALVPNMKGLEKALLADVDEVAVFMSASDTHNKKNINKSIEETFPVLEETIREAKASGKKVRGYLSTVFGCPYEGHVSPEQAEKVTTKLLEMGVYEVSLGDTIGVGNPRQVESNLNQWTASIPKENLALHFHNTRGMALANTLVGMSAGITTIDGSLGGLGGCPYAKGASGNLATDDLIHMLSEMGIDSGIDLGSLVNAGHFIETSLEKPLISHQMEIARAQKAEQTS
ncbi:hydroxymethylglutaryl-CoA lyase [Alteribacter keqinensis]|uniref:Hydroxymethylglutaryl-CoA lyase n=1 Tax=Alteribacter keqinensis TaxID=2483800 RepID=A0A3M7TT99_9BACI|nr:hydroxymethylglutaryl-CoA lyase [Alteribacter keqinensis]RNA68673.1 hydroxymethylglutaryl-CoA lyase [Alteribacter keqinensis]